MKAALAAIVGLWCAVFALALLLNGGEPGLAATVATVVSIVGLGVVWFVLSARSTRADGEAPRDVFDRMDTTNPGVWLIAIVLGIGVLFFLAWRDQLSFGL
ncbi:MULTISPECIES: hypothetical protein [Maricaulis]|uniref:Uncharacterized protein n=1 Tax=Maricaulis virginensis TaxID=144022 RepID=A0A9W6ILG0_9PROT|nr:MULTISPECIES: hypothetical protein [Maricaulis]MBO6763930.1 hypothetical protein [Maricaulis sp.]GLK51290.1 hypothetical protein GCM10017621_07980 [Maricaulis virginensis]